jgi:aryl-alcohol dehydrogenase-like predicted oxidoreductase/enamine deaminase RidA (YjgF/YER057c/UK114 family)
LTTPSAPPRTEIAPGLLIPRIVTGLWQVADQERGGGPLDPDRAADVLAEYAAAGFDAFDMADHYGSAEVIAGRLLARGVPAAAFTKWVPTPGPMDAATVREGVGRSVERLGAIPALMQFHWWTFEHPAYLDALAEMAAMRARGELRHLGLTNFDTDHLRIALGQGIPVATNQVSFSLLDRRAAGDMSALCLARGVRLLAYGTLGGGFLTDHWVGRAEPAESDIPDWSRMKYRRFIGAMGGWPVFRGLLDALAAIARRHGVSVANVATRWVLEQPAVGPSSSAPASGSGSTAPTTSASSPSRSTRRTATASPTPSATRAPSPATPATSIAARPFSLRAATSPTTSKPSPAPTPPPPWRAAQGASAWTPAACGKGIAGYSRAVRDGNRILVSGTTATHGSTPVCPGNPGAQAAFILDKIAASLAALGGRMEDVVRTRIYLRDAERDWEPVSRVHGRVLGHVRPANTLVEARLVGGYLVEMEAEAVVGGDTP